MKEKSRKHYFSSNSGKVAEGEKKLKVKEIKSEKTKKILPNTSINSLFI